MVGQSSQYAEPMVPIFESTLPIFLLVMLGVALKRLPLVDRSVWHGLEEIGFYVLFPALLFLTIYRADFSGLQLGGMAAGSILTVLALFVVLVLSWPIFRRQGITLPVFTTVIQTTTRWNAFVAIAIAEKLMGESGLALTVLILALIVLPINLGNVGLMVWYLSSTPDMGKLIRKVVSNPIVLACLAGLLARSLGLGIYPPLEQSINLVADAALGMGLIMVGAGLRIRETVRPRPVAIFCTFAKLLVYPVVLTGACWMFGVHGEALIIAALCGAVPTAMNGYLLARQLGGDAPLYATIATLQTVGSFVTIPLVIYAATYLASG